MGKLEEMLRTDKESIAASVGAGHAAGIAPPGLNPAEAQRLPARLQGVAKAKDALVIPTDKIQPDPDQPREDFDPESLERLAESLKTKGQLQPIRVRWDAGRGFYVIIAGERRWRAAMQAGLPALGCVVHEGPPEPGALLALQLVENALREDLKPIEQAKAYRRLMAANGWSGHQLARELSLTQSSVSRTLALLELPEAVRGQVDAGELSARTAYEIGKLADPSEQVALAERAAADKLTGDQVEAVVKARKIGKQGAAPAPKVEFKFDDGAKVAVTLPPGASGDAAVLEMLQRAVKRVRAGMKVAGPGHAA
jgi:ParB family chromosome partitioning protein